MAHTKDKINVLIPPLPADRLIRFFASFRAVLYQFDSTDRIEVLVSLGAESNPTDR